MTAQPVLDNIFSTAKPRIYSVASGRPFLNDFALALRAALGAEDEAALADATIFLPNRRAVRALNDAFLETAPLGRACLTPHTRAIGDVDEDEFVLFSGDAADEIDLPPAISREKRRLILASLVAEKEKAFFDGQKRWAGAIAAADELGKLLDALYTEEIAADALAKVVPEALATHWAQSLEFLSIVAEAWPAYLANEELMDPAERRIALIDRQCKRWRDAPPQTPVIIAGTTGSTPAVARLMKTVATLPKGCVVLPGLDLLSPERVWNATDAPHPQSGLKALLDALEVTRRDVRSLPHIECAEKTKTETDRQSVFSIALRPANASDDWRRWAKETADDPVALSQALNEVEIVEAADEDKEASAVAIRLRGAVETPDKTAFLVTPDRNLARRVALKLRRWNITVDDSAGTPFPNTSCGAFLRLTANWLMNVANPVSLMAVLDHPRFGGGIEEAKLQKAKAQFDIALRGLRPADGIAGLRQKLHAHKKFSSEGQALLAKLEAAIQCWPGADASFSERFGAHLEVSEMLAKTADEKDTEALWRGDDGEAGADYLAKIKDSFDYISGDRLEDYGDIFARLISDAVVRQRAPTHPRLAILGPLEARLQQADVVILGGLNEGVWPRDAAIDPFLSRPMRNELGLPSPERRIGLSAHDFSQFSAAPEVMLTRSARTGGKPAKPSRWIVRLKNILSGAGAEAAINKTAYYESLAIELDRPGEPIWIEAPQPTPPQSVRPKEFFVTQIEKLLRDPYAIYATKILGLRKLDPLDEPFGDRALGNLVHKVFNDIAENSIAQDAQDSLPALRKVFEQRRNEYGLDESHLAFWDDIIEAALVWFAEWDANRRQLGTPVILEEKGFWEFQIGDTGFSLGAKADRIDRLTSGGAHIIDYKTGTPPSKSQTTSISPQLPLTGVIVQKGGFENLGAVETAGFEYVRAVLRKSNKTDETAFIGAEAAAAVTDAEERLLTLLKHYNDPTTPYLSQPRPQFVDDYGDFDHLARRRERNAVGGNE